MKYLLDTHVLLWMLENDPSLSLIARQEIENLENKCYVSMTSLYEVAIKKNIGKIATPHTIVTFAKEINNVGLILLPIEVEHLETYLSLPQFDNHKDPFDRLIIATSLAENFVIISIDEKFKLYQGIIRIVW
jgi:PIN domain nuclease of toxin-antitoxin system